MIWRLCISFSIAAAMLSLGSCAKWRAATVLPAGHHIVLDQLIVFSDTPLPAHHRLLEELRAQRTLVSTKLALPISDEPIHVYLFPTAERLDAFMQTHYPSVPSRRAFFVETDTRLSVYAHWGDHVAEDLRHEVAHGYLHGLVPNLPLWLDEGLAEYFEVPRGQGGINRPHVEHLALDLQNGWRPDLARLERLQTTGDMTQADYAESWAWVHFLLESSPARNELLRGYLGGLVRGNAEPIGAQLARYEPDSSQRLADYLSRLRSSLR